MFVGGKNQCVLYFKNHIDIDTNKARLDIPHTEKKMQSICLQVGVRMSTVSQNTGKQGPPVSNALLGYGEFSASTV